MAWLNRAAKRLGTAVVADGGAAGATVWDAPLPLATDVTLGTALTEGCEDWESDDAVPDTAGTAADLPGTLKEEDNDVEPFAVPAGSAVLPAGAGAFTAGDGGGGKEEENEGTQRSRRAPSSEKATVLGTAHGSCSPTSQVGSVCSGSVASFSSIPRIAASTVSTASALQVPSRFPPSTPVATRLTGGLRAWAAPGGGLTALVLPLAFLLRASWSRKGSSVPENVDLSSKNIEMPSISTNRLVLFT